MVFQGANEGTAGAICAVGLLQIGQ
jgi:hypothetical protein